jgi:hypothetical protein
LTVAGLTGDKSWGQGALAGGGHPDEPKIISGLKPVRSGLLMGQGQAGIPIWKSKYYNRFRPVLATMIYVKIIEE